MQADKAPPLPDNTIEILAALTFAAILASAVALIAGGLVRRLLSSVEGRHQLSAPLRKAPVRLVRLVAFVVSTIAFAFPALAFVGIDLPVELQGGRLGRWVAQTGLRIGVIILIAVTTNRLVAAIISRAEREIAGGGGPADLERRKRAQTIGNTFRGFLSGTIWVTALLMILRTLDVDITPVLTGAGIVGLAVGFGAQTLVKDIISGFFLILEDQIRVGDVALVNGIGGSVEQINLRTIVLRDGEGAVHVIPNGSITTLANRSHRAGAPGGGRASAGSRIRAAHPRASGSVRRGQLQRVVGDAQVPDQDAAAEPVDRRTRAAPAGQEIL
jgi:small conductance mechanosensitive channel